MNQQLLYHIALTAIPNIGNITAKKLIAYCGGAKAVFTEKKGALEKIPGIGVVNASRIIDHKAEALVIAEQELTFIDKNSITALCFNDNSFPKRLSHCEDGPIVLFSKGDFDYNAQKVISIVGTRKATDYGKDFCEQLLENLKPHNPLIVSGLAFGVDICAHKEALKNNLPTIGVTAHGLDRLYPSQHKSIADQMLSNGGLVSEFLSGTKPDRENFPKRNRIVAGLADAIIVIESSKKGGSLITAELGNSYNRDVFALPGRITDSQSEGCNALIKQNKAHLLQSFKDLEYIMGWEAKTPKNNKQVQLFIELNPEEQLLFDLLKEQDKTNIDDLALKAKFPMSKTASILLEMEFNNIVKSLPGKMYKVI
jgi:DNA processing protein